MADLATYETNLKNLEGQLGQYGANLPSEIETQIQAAYTPALQKSLDVTSNQMGDYLGRYFDVTQMGPGTQGTSAIDLSPTQKLGVMGRELGTMSGNLQASQRYSDYLGGQMNDMYQKALGAAQMGQQNLASQYERQFQLYQLAWQEAEAEKDRQASIRAAQIAASVYNQPTTETPPLPKGTPIDIQKARYEEYQRQGYSDEEAYNYSTQGIPEDKPITSQQGGVVGLLGKIWGKPLDWLSGKIYGESENRYSTPKSSSAGGW